MSTKDIYENIEYLMLYNELNTRINNVTIDTRKIKPGDCYIGIKGEKMMVISFIWMHLIKEHL